MTIEQGDEPYINPKHEGVELVVLAQRRWPKFVVLLVLLYFGLVVIFESLLGYFQPTYASTLIIATTSDDGEERQRVLQALNIDGELYVAVNHWPRNWYRRVLNNPSVSVVTEEGSGEYVAHLLKGEEHNQIAAKNDPGLVFRFLTGFPPRYFLWLEKT
jgi:hypothetical protein